MSDEELPIAGAEVGVQGSNSSVVRTDAVGRFAFSELTPGEYRIIAQALGYATSAKKIDVVAGSIAQANFTLKAQSLEPTERPNELTMAKNTLYLHIKSSSPRYWLDTQTKNSTANNQHGGYNPLGFVIGDEPGAATWSISMSPELPADVKLDTSKPVEIVLYIGRCLEGADSGYVMVTTELVSGETKLLSGPSQTADYKGNLVKLEWSGSAAADTIKAADGLTWNIRAQGAGSQICLGAYSEALSRIVLPVA